MDGVCDRLQLTLITCRENGIGCVNFNNFKMTMHQMVTLNVKSKK